MNFKFYIPKRLPGMNEIIKWSKQPVPWLCKGRRKVFKYTLQKKEIESYIYFKGIQPALDLHIKKHSKLPYFEEIALIEFTWFEENRRRDPSNVCAGGRKFILDALVKHQIIKNDNWLINRHIDFFMVDKKQTGVQVIIKS